MGEEYESLAIDEREYLERVRAFARERVAPFAADWERLREFPAATFREGARLGLSGLLVGKELGGLGLSHVAMAHVLEDVAGACFAFGFTLFVHHNVLAGIARYGTPAQVARFLEPMLSGERVGAFCLTEPQAGSDAAGIATIASKCPGGWEVHGEKAWVTNGSVADVYSIYAQTDPSLGWRGIACFLVEGHARGLRRHSPYALVGAHAMATNGITLERCVLSDSDLLLGPGKGFKGAMAGINRARMTIAAMCCGILKASLEAAVEYTADRRAFGRPVGSFQGLQFALADVATELEAARLLAYRAARLLDAGETAMIEAAHAKKFATRAALSGITTCMRAMGANGLKTVHPIGRHLASAQVCQYLDGTDEMQNIIIGRGLYGGREQH